MKSRYWLAIAAVLVVFSSGGGLLVLGAFAMISGTSGSGIDDAVSGESECGKAAPGEPVVLEKGEPRENAKTIVEVGRRLKIPERGLVIAVATAMQESQLRNLKGGDADSIGLFQQRPSTGWGTPAQTHDPVLATEAFFGLAEHTSNRGLTDVKGWEGMPLTVAAQEVQRSAYPAAYAQWESKAALAVEQILRGGPVRQCTKEVVPVAGACPATTDYSGFQNGRIPDNALCHLDFAPQHRLRSDAALAAEELSRAYKRRWGHPLCVTDSYRSLAEQVDVRRRKGSMAAIPGTSKHGWARALDLCDHVNVDSSPQWAWMRANAPEFGWQNPPWALAGGSGPYEPWHWEWRT